jgi:hypothetical protein
MNANKNILRSSAFICGSFPFIFPSVVSAVPLWFSSSPLSLGALGDLGGSIFFLAVPHAPCNNVRTSHFRLITTQS